MLLLLYCCSIVVRASWQEIPWDVSVEDTFGKIEGVEISEDNALHASQPATATKGLTAEQRVIILQGMLKYPSRGCSVLMQTLFGTPPKLWECNFYRKIKLRGKLSLCIYEEMQRHFVTDGAAYVPQASQLNALCGTSFAQTGPALKEWLDIVIAPKERPIKLNRRGVEIIQMTREQFGLLLKAEMEQITTASNVVVSPLAMEHQVTPTARSLVGAGKKSFLLLMKENPLFPAVWDIFSKIPHTMSATQALNLFTKTRLKARLSRCVYEELRKVPAAERRRIYSNRPQIHRKCPAWRRLGDWELWMKIVIAPGEEPNVSRVDKVEMTPVQFEAMIDYLINQQEATDA